MDNVTDAAGGSDNELHLDQFGLDDDDWYIMQCAYEHGRDPFEAVQVVRRRQAAQRRAQRHLAPSQGVGGGKPQSPAVAEATGAGVQWPPGVAGAIARFIFANSYSPVREVATVATLALLAGVCGRAYRTYTGKDLALYLILVAKSGIGKDSTHDGIPAMLKLSGSPLADRFVRAQDFVSGEALHKELLREPGFLALQGEFGRKLKRMSNPHDTPMQNLRTVMTNAYGKAFLEGKSYSNSDNSLDGVDWPSLSFLGETTPATFLECLTPDMMADGFLSRFLCVTYEGDRPPPNRQRSAVLDPGLLQMWKGMVSALLVYQMPLNTPPPNPVQPADDARALLEQFEVQCIGHLNATEDESERQVWSRAHLKALKVASLLAVADHPWNPLVKGEHVTWALALVRRDIELFQSRQRSGDVGIDDNARERKLVTFLREYLLNGAPASYKVHADMRQNSIVPRSYLQKRASTLNAFTNHKLGPVRALDEAIRNLIDNGYVMDVDKLKLIEAYSYFGRAYRILRLPD